MLSKFLTFIKSKYFIAALLFTIIALCIWFVGPMIGVNEWHPFESKLLRISLIIWLFILAIFIIARWTLAPFIIITAAILIWFTLPLISFADYRPFDSVVTRVVLIGLILFVALIYGVVRLLKALQKDPELFNKIFRNKNRESIDPELSKQIDTIDKKILWTLSQLKISNLKNKAVLRPFTKKNYLYAVPWYLSIGTPQSGKTSTILNSGIQLTDPAQVRQASAYLSINAQGPQTQECDIWLSHDAVFVDAPGKYLDENNEHNRSIWRGLLHALKRHRPKTPINGVIVNISVEEIIKNTDLDNIKLAATLREQILSIKKELGVLFPVYFSITKADKLIGFKEYFQSLTEEGRAHPWGFLLPLSKEFNNLSSKTPELTIEQVSQEMNLLSQELEKNLFTRLEEENDLEYKQALYALPEEFKSLSQRIIPIINTIFIESTFGLPELNQSLRGVFFVSAMQDNIYLEAKNDTIIGRYQNDLNLEPSVPPLNLTGNKPFFINQVYKQTIISEGRLVKPNYEWQVRNTIFRYLMYALILITFSWFSYSFYTSFTANEHYLNAITVKTKDLENKVQNLYKNFKQDNIPDVLDAAATLPSLIGWDLNHPLLERQYGLYMPDSIIAASNYTYTKLTDNLLLSQLVNRMEQVMQEAVQTENKTDAAETLNVYLMLNDISGEHYNYKIIKSWITKDWMENSAQYNFGEKSSVFEHLNNLFVQDRVVKSPFIKNEPLIKEVRRLLETQSSSTRIYNRTKSIVSVEAPKDFTLISIIGPDASTAFRFASGKNLDYGVPGIYTYDGYHNVFKPRLKAIIAEAILNDKWLMGREETASNKNPIVDLSLLDDIKKQYLKDYEQIWSTFIADIDAATGDNLAYDINVLRIYASPNSPLSRLTEALVKETTLLQENNSLLNAATDQAKNTNMVGANVKKTAEVATSQIKSTLSQEALLEKTLVDDHFSTLREMVIGQADFSNKNIKNASLPSTATSSNTGAAITSLDGYNSLINELYMYTSVANATITTGGLPQSSLLETRARLEAERLPAPFKRILTSLTTSSTSKIKKEKEIILTQQAQIQFDELMMAYQNQVSVACKQNISGKYPFAKNTPYEVSIDDFAQFFASNGLVDNFFNKYLTNYIDTSSSPWKYKTIEALNIQRAIASNQAGSSAITPPNTNSDEPTLEGEYLKLLMTQGPNPEFFFTANEIKQAFFQEGGQRLLVKYSYNIIEVDPMITELILNFDGNIQRYVHNPAKDKELTWPSPKLSGAEIEIIANPKIRLDTSTVKHDGPWALFKLLDKSKIIHSTNVNKSLLELHFEERKVLLEVSTQSSKNALNLNSINRFKCW